MKMSIRALGALVLAVGLVAGVSALVAAGDPAAMAKGQPDMAAMKAEMMKCAICKNMAAHMDELGPVMKAEVVHLPNGMAMLHTITDPAKVASYHAVSKAMADAGTACMSFTDEQAKTQLCSFCQEFRQAAKAGASISSGPTKNGDILVLISNDPAVQKQITGIESKCAMMASAM